MDDHGMRIEDLSEVGPELDEEQLAAVTGAQQGHSKTMWVECGCTDCDKAF